MTSSVSETEYSYLNTFGLMVKPARLASSNSSDSSELRTFLATILLVSFWTFVTDVEDIIPLIKNYVDVLLLYYEFQVFT